MEETFTQMLLRFMEERKITRAGLYKDADIDRKLIYKILKQKDYQPKKGTAVRLALGLRLNLAETQKLLGKAGYALTRSSKADLVVQYYIERKIYSVTFINEALADCGLPLLKTGLKS